MEKELLEELQGKISFVYELNGKLYAIGHCKVFNCIYSKVVAPDFTRLFQIYKSNIENSRDEVYKNNIAKVMFQLSSYANSEVQMEDNEEHLITIEEFLNGISDNEKVLIKNQIDEFVEMFKKTGMVKLYPSVSYVF